MKKGVVYFKKQADILFVSGRRVSKSTQIETAVKNFIKSAQTGDKASVWQIRKGRVRIHLKFPKTINKCPNGGALPKRIWG